MRLRGTRSAPAGHTTSSRHAPGPSPYGVSGRKTTSRPPSSTFTEPLTGYVRAGRHLRGYLALFAMVGCFGLAAAGIIQYLGTHFDEMRQRAMDRPAFRERRPVRASDLDYYSLHTFYDSYYHTDVAIRLVNDHGVTRLVVANRQGDVLLKRRLVPSDLDQERILQSHQDRTGDAADTVELYYRGGTAMMVVRSSEFDM